MTRMIQLQETPSHKQTKQRRSQHTPSTPGTIPLIQPLQQPHTHTN